MQKKTETQFGWWGDQPDQEGRPSLYLRAASEYQSLRKGMRLRQQRERLATRTIALAVGSLITVAMAIALIALSQGWLG